MPMFFYRVMAMVRVAAAPISLVCWDHCPEASVG
jgi:hypothetical protein